MDINYEQINKELWNDRTTHHVQSEFYDMENFLEGKSPLNSIELNLLGDVSGKTMLHLQCHFGMDTLAFARLGANVTGIDISDNAISEAKKLAEKTNLEGEFVCCSVYDVPQHISKQFDIVFTSYGTIGWLPDMNRWAGVVSKMLKPGGIFVFAEFHPAVWMFDNDFEKVAYSYFNREDIVEELEGTYADRNAPMKKKSISWNHDIAEVLQALLNNGLTLERFEEFDYSPYNCFNKTVPAGEGKFYIAGMEQKLPMVYALRMRK